MSLATRLHYSVAGHLMYALCMLFHADAECCINVMTHILARVATDKIPAAATALVAALVGKVRISVRAHRHILFSV